MNKSKRKWIWGLLALLVLGGGAGGFLAMQANSKAAAEAKKKEESKPPTLPEFTPAELGRVGQQVVQRTVVASGSLVAARSATVRSKASAEIKSLELREGDVVKVGQALVQLDALEATERVRAAQGVVVSAEARANNAKTVRDTQKGLLDKAYISQAAFDGFESAYRAALGDLDSAKANVALARQGVADAAVRSPMNGVVAKRFVNVGEKVSFDSPLVQIVDLSSLELQAWVDPDAVGQIKQGQAVLVTVAGFDQAIQGQVARLMPQVDSATRQLGMVVQLKPSGLPLKAGLDATARLNLAASNQASTVVPINALQSANGEPFVWTVQDSAAGGTVTVKRLRLALGARDEAAGVVAATPPADAGPLSPGTTVLLGRYDGLKDGQAIKKVAAKSASVSASPAPAASAASAPSTPASSAKS